MKLVTINPSLNPHTENVFGLKFNKIGLLLCHSHVKLRLRLRLSEVDIEAEVDLRLRLI